MAIKNYDTVADDNADINGVDIRGSAPASNMDNGLREVQADLAKMNDGTEPIQDTITFEDPDDATKQFRFDGGNVGTGQKRIIFVPDKDITLGGPISKTLTELTSGTTYTPDAAVVFFDATAVGGGAGGGGVDGQGSGTSGGGDGGGAGATCITYGVVPSGSYTYSIGAAGTGGASGANGGGSGGDTTISGTGLSLMTAGGGTGGTGRTGTATIQRPKPFNGGTATGGEVNIDGSRGLGTVITDGNAISFSFGGDSTHGKGGEATISTNGAVGTGYGVGGGGGMSENATTNRSGAAGTQGVIYITEYRND